MIKNKLTICVKSFNHNVVKMRKIATLSEIDEEMKKKTIQIEKYVLIFVSIRNYENHMFILCNCCFSKNKKISEKCWIINIKNIIHTINEKSDTEFQIWFTFQIKCNRNIVKNIKIYDCQFFQA